MTEPHFPPSLLTLIHQHWRHLQIQPTKSWPPGPSGDEIQETWKFPAALHPSVPVPTGLHLPPANAFIDEINRFCYKVITGREENA